MGVQLKAFPRSKLEGFYKTTECTLSRGALELEASVWQMEQDETKYDTKKKKIQMTGVSPSDWPWFERFDQMFGSTPRLIAFSMQLITECIICIHILKFKLLRWMMMWHMALKNILIHHNKLVFLVMEMKKRFMFHL